MPKRSSTRAKNKGKITLASVDETLERAKNQAAVTLGRLGGKKGGPARAAKLSATRRQEIARRAAEVRWRKDEEHDSG